MNSIDSEEFERAQAAIDMGMWGRARKLLERAAIAGDNRASLRLALFHLHGLGGLNVDPVLATRGFDHLADINVPEAHYHLATMALSDQALVPHASYFEHLSAAVSLKFMPALRALGVCGQAGWTLALARDAGCALSGKLLERFPGIDQQTRMTPDSLAQALKATVAFAPMTEAQVGERVRVTDDVLTDLECQFLRFYCGESLTPAMVKDPRTGQSIRSPIRTNYQTTLTSDRADLTVRMIERKLAMHAGSDLLHAEPIGILRYKLGEEYKPHRDYLHDAVSLADNTPGQRLRTAFCYLSDVEMGGETDFLHWAKRVTPKAGRVVVFDNAQADGKPIPDSVHASLPVQLGEKWLATLWFRQRNARAW